MKKIIILLAIFLTAIIYAQAPNKMSYQAVIRDTNNTLVDSSPIGMRISILQGTDIGTPVYIETQTINTNSNGLISTEIGSGQIVSGTFSTINWANGPYFIKTETDINGGSNYDITSSSQLMSVPYALFAAASGNSIPNGTNVGEMLYWNGTNWNTIAPGTTGQTLSFCNGTPKWGLCNVTLPTITTKAITSIGNSTASSGGDITSNGGDAITQSGICYSINPNSTILNNIVSNAIGDSNFNSTMDNLIPNTTYYVRAFATNSAGTNYGNEINFTTLALQIGQNYQGGIIAYISQPSEIGYTVGEVHGLIVAPSDFTNTSLNWTITNTVTNANSTIYGYGQANTNLIIADQGSGIYAAKLCSDLVINNYNDWYLPSKDELNKIFLNKNTIGTFTLPDSTYWSSSEVVGNNANTNAYFLTFTSSASQNVVGVWWSQAKIRLIGSNPIKVRAVRNF
jgi:hypothetical protein